MSQENEIVLLQALQRLYNAIQAHLTSDMSDDARSVARDRERLKEVMSDTLELLRAQVKVND